MQQLELEQSNLSQRKRILAALQKGEKLTQLDMLYRFGAGQSGTRIFELRQQGHNIETRMIRKGRKRFAEYYMPPSN
jgi:hypothetical protein